MKVLVYIENDGGTIKKSSLEALTVATSLGEVVGVTLSDISNAADAGKYGASKVLTVSGLSASSSEDVANALAELSGKEGAEVIVMAHSSVSEGASGRLAVQLDASVATNVMGLPDTSSGFKVKRGVYTGKAFLNVELPKTKKVLTIKKNSVELTESGSEASVEAVSLGVSADAAITVKEVKKQEGDILLPEADLVVSAGRGLKGPENWGMIEDLAKTLGAATACSKPVSDADWRPHHEHVGQTGIKVSPNLYIAVGISGAIQHLAGVSSSKVIVVINTDAEAPFFKAADYGIVGDAFEVIPKLNEALKNA